MSIMHNQCSDCVYCRPDKAKWLSPEKKLEFAKCGHVENIHNYYCETINRLNECKTHASFNSAEAKVAKMIEQKKYCTKCYYYSSPAIGRALCKCDEAAEVDYISGNHKYKPVNKVRKEICGTLGKYWKPNHPPISELEEEAVELTRQRNIIEKRLVELDFLMAGHTEEELKEKAEQVKK